MPSYAARLAAACPGSPGALTLRVRVSSPCSPLNAARRGLQSPLIPKPRGGFSEAPRGSGPAPPSCPPASHLRPHLPPRGPRPATCTPRSGRRPKSLHWPHAPPAGRPQRPSRGRAQPLHPCLGPSTAPSALRGAQHSPLAAPWAVAPSSILSFSSSWILGSLRTAPRQRAAPQPGPPQPCRVLVLTPSEPQFHAARPQRALQTHG